MRNKSLHDYVLEYEREIEQVQEACCDAILHWFRYVVSYGEEFTLDTHGNVNFFAVEDGKIIFTNDAGLRFKYTPRDLKGKLIKDNELYV